jgi:hypothetical protein
MGTMGVLQQAVTAAFLTNWEIQAFYRGKCLVEDRHECKKAYVLVV